MNSRLYHLLLLLLWCISRPVLAGEPIILLPKNHIEASELAVVINDNDPYSTAVGNYYVQRRHIPAANVIHVQLPVNKATLTRQEFGDLKQQLDQATPSRVQAYALVWLKPYRVECMSITTAVSSGLDQAFCSDQRCAVTRRNPLFNSDSSTPYTDYGWRPSMLLAASDVEHGKALVDRGIAADNSQPEGTAYLLETPDKARSVRAVGYPLLRHLLQGLVNIEILQQKSISQRQDVLFYFTGLTRVPDIDSNHYMPGAIADHLTSAGGILDGSRQMSSLRWLEAGATGSYGTVVEPCNLLAKFPDPTVVMGHYLRGNTLLEAYWKSVLMPGEGVFIGEPLARPFGGYTLAAEQNHWRLYTRDLSPGNYLLYGADNSVGPYVPLVQGIKVGLDSASIVLPRVNKAYYRLVKQVVPRRRGNDVPVID
jgi:uncharacterized protein (TIGR03790 family)